MVTGFIGQLQSLTIIYHDAVANSNSIPFTLKSIVSSQSLFLHHCSGTGFKRRTFRSWIPELFLSHNHNNSYARMQRNSHCTAALRPRVRSAGNITVLSTRYHGKATRYLAMGVSGGLMTVGLGCHVTIYILKEILSAYYSGV
jgi:hypothetical protein